MKTFTRSIINIFLVTVSIGCTGAPPESATPAITLVPSPTESSPADACPVTEPTWAKPPEDSAVDDPPAYGYYFLNEDRSIWASAGWAEDAEYTFPLGGAGIKVGWFRPAGAELVITGRRLDGEEPPFKGEALSGYPTRFQASALPFPAGGCWEITATAAESTLSFVVWLEP